MKKLKTGTERQEGVAIVTAMFIMFLAASVAGFMIWKEDTWIRQVENVTYRSQADALASAVLRWTGVVLLEKVVKENGGIGDDGMEAISAFPVDNGEAASAAENMQGRFNINNLLSDGKVSERHVKIFKKILIHLELPERLADAAVDWIDPDTKERSIHGAEDNYYLKLDPPYITANMAMASMSELRMVKGFSDDIVDILRPYITALPSPTQLDVNSASSFTLAAYIDGLKISEAEDLVNSREYSRIKNIGDFRSRLPDKITAVNEKDFTVKSQFYMVTVNAKIERAVVGYDAMLKLDQSGASLAILWLKGS